MKKFVLPAKGSGEPGLVPRLLRFLRPGEYVSGQDLAARLGLTRAAVWKQIQTLRGLGYEIEAHPRRGYLLLSRPDRLYPWEVQAGLATRYLGRKIEYYEELPSTNERAKELLAAGPEEGTLVLAEKQTRGRGRLGRNWFSPPESGIWMTLILTPGMPLLEMHKLTLTAAAVLSRAIFAELGFRPLVKWPNDLYVDGKKISGILTELAGEIGRTEYLLLGIGINVNQTPADFPEELREKAGSLRMKLGVKIDRPALLRSYLRLFEEEYNRVRAEGFGEVLAYCRRYSATLGRQVEVATGNQRYRGKAVAIRDDGSLSLRLEDGGTIDIYAGDVLP